MSGWDLIALAFGAAGVVLLVPAVVLLLEILAALLPERARPGNERRRPRIAVLVPAHDERLMIAGTVETIRNELMPGDTVLVVADNCSDGTADIARSSGAEVIERFDPEKRGKSYALGFGMRHLARTAPDVVIVVDADCKPDPGTIEAIGRRAFETDRPVQALYELLMPGDDRPSPGLSIAAFAFKVKNQLRAEGLSRLGLPCQLMGTGMAFPRAALRSVELETGELAEDLVLGLDLARAGYPALFAADARVTSPHPASESGRRSQRERWESGHLSTIWSRVPPLILAAVTAFNIPLLALALDAAIPPLAFHVLLLAGLFAAAVPVALISGHWAPLALAALALALVAAAVLVAWLRVGKDNLHFTDLARVPFYTFSKVPIYLRTMRGKSISWVRSKRD